MNVWLFSGGGAERLNDRLGSKLAIHHMPAIDRFLEAIAREQTDRFRPNSVTPDRMH
jgi:hypothetical protein